MHINTSGSQIFKWPQSTSASIQGLLALGVLPGKISCPQTLSPNSTDKKTEAERLKCFVQGHMADGGGGNQIKFCETHKWLSFYMGHCFKVHPWRKWCPALLKRTTLGKTAKIRTELNAFNGKHQQWCFSALDNRGLMPPWLCLWLDWSPPSISHLSLGVSYSTKLSFCMGIVYPERL